MVVSLVSSELQHGMETIIGTRLADCYVVVGRRGTVLPSASVNSSEIELPGNHMAVGGVHLMCPVSSAHFLVFWESC